MYVWVTLLLALGFKKKKKRIKEKKRQRKKLWSFAPSDFSPTRIEEALKTWDCVLWVNRGKEISVMWAFVLLTHKSVTTSLFLVIPPHCVWIRSHGQATALEEALKDSLKNITWANSRALMQNNGKGDVKKQQQTHALMRKKRCNYGTEHIHSVFRICYE